jgi:hypothetical protein
MGKGYSRFEPITIASKYSPGFLVHCYHYGLWDALILLIIVFVYLMLCI